MLNFWKKDDPYITFLKYTRGMMREGKTPHFTETFAFVHDLHPAVKQDAFQNIFFQAMEPVADQEGVAASYADRIKNKILYVLNMASYFHLLEYEELREARLASRTAAILALFAIVIAGIAVINQ